jgi:hypothetical protein
MLGQIIRHLVIENGLLEDRVFSATDVQNEENFDRINRINRMPFNPVDSLQFAQMFHG